MSRKHIGIVGIVGIMALAASCSAAAAGGAWTAKDSGGGTVVVPGDRTSVLVFLRVDQPQSADELAQLQTAMDGRKDVAMIGILSGDDADTHAASLAANPKWSAMGGVTVADANYAASGRYDVHVWPTTVIVSRSGEQIARIPGLPISFANDLPAYLDFAAGKIDRPSLDKRLVERAIVTDSPDQKAGRHIEVAQRLALQGMKDDARAELAKAAALNPKEPATLLRMARVALITGDAAGAEKMLAEVGEAGGMQARVLAGWCAVQRGQWDDARKTLAEAAALNPDPAEAFYLYGLVLQHDGDAAKAAEYFRKAFEHTDFGKEMVGGN